MALNSYKRNRAMKLYVNGKEVTDPRSKKIARAGCTAAGCGLVVGIIGGVIGIGIALLAVFAPNTLNGLMSGLTGQNIVVTQAIMGDPAKFDPIAGYAQAKAFAGEGAILIDMRASQVRADGTTDLTATYSPAPYVEYQFALPVARPDNAPPVGAGGNSNGQWYIRVEITAFKPGERRRVSQTSGGVRLSYTYVNEGITRDESVPSTSVPDFAGGDPTCSFAAFWQEAIKRDAPADAVATIVYNNAGYDFSIQGLSIDLEFDAECKLVSD
jgi:hypothetical protein